MKQTQEQLNYKIVNPLINGNGTTGTIKTFKQAKALLDLGWIEFDGKKYSIAGDDCHRPAKKVELPFLKKLRMEITYS